MKILFSLLLCYIFCCTQFEIASSSSKLSKSPKISLVEKDIPKTCVNLGSKDTSLLSCEGGAIAPKVELSLPALKLILQVNSHLFSYQRLY